jgi:hypothetical protein
LALALVERFGGMSNVVDNDRIAGIGSCMNLGEYWTENIALRRSIQCISVLLYMALLVLLWPLISFAAESDNLQSIEHMDDPMTQ